MFMPVSSPSGDRGSLDNSRAKGHKLNMGSHLDRRAPKQDRARATVDAMLDSVGRILKQGGVDAVTTNRVAEVAGVSIGSVYQYFADKRAIFMALHERHAEEMCALVESTLVEHASDSLPVTIRALIDALVTAHGKDAELNALMWKEVPHRSAGSEERAARLNGAWRLTLATRTRLRRAELDRVVFFVIPMVESLVHAVMARPASMSAATAKAEAVRAIMAYVEG